VGADIASIIKRGLRRRPRPASRRQG